jgi:hypothetical protein
MKVQSTIVGMESIAVTEILIVTTAIPLHIMMIVVVAAAAVDP